MPLKEATIGDIQLCGEFMANQFASCSVDKLMYLGSCASYLSNGSFKFYLSRVFKTID